MTAATDRNCYRISRRSMYAALKKLGVDIKQDKIPLDVTGEWTNVEVEAGYDWKKPEPNLILPKVKLAARGVANRVRVVCPACLVAEVRFGGLAQHAGSKTCKALNAARLAAIAKADAHAGRAEGFNVSDLPDPVVPEEMARPRITSYVCDRGPCSYHWDGSTGDFTGGHNRPLCPNCMEGYGAVKPVGFRQTYVQMASHEYDSNTPMEGLAAELLKADDGDPARPLIVIVQEHGGWRLSFAWVGGKIRVVGSANDAAQFSDAVEAFKNSIRTVPLDPAGPTYIVRPEKETEGEKDKWMCSDNPGTGAIYTCKSMTCPVHGQRNIEDAR